MDPRQLFMTSDYSFGILKLFLFQITTTADYEILDFIKYYLQFLMSESNYFSSNPKLYMAVRADNAI